MARSEVRRILDDLPNLFRPRGDVALERLLVSTKWLSLKSYDIRKLDIHHDTKFVKRIIELYFITKLVLSFTEIKGGQEGRNEKPRLKMWIMGKKMMTACDQRYSQHRSR